MRELKLQFAFTAHAALASPIAIGDTPDGLRRFVPIVGGTFEGPLLRGSILPAGGDWQILRADGVLNVEARYILKTNDGVLIAVHNCGIRHAPPDVAERMNRGETVPPNSYYFRTSAQFEAPVDGPYNWVNRTLFAAIAEREPEWAIIHFYRID